MVLYWWLHKWLPMYWWLLFRYLCSMLLHMWRLHYSWFVLSSQPSSSQCHQTHEMERLIQYFKCYHFRHTIFRLFVDWKSAIRITRYAWNCSEMYTWWIEMSIKPNVATRWMIQILEQYQSPYQRWYVIIFGFMSQHTQITLLDIDVACTQIVQNDTKQRWITIDKYCTAVIT